MSSFYGRPHGCHGVEAPVTSVVKRTLQLLAAALIALAALAPAAAAQSTPCALNVICEAETGTLHDGAGTEDEHAGYTGTGFVDQLFGDAGVVLRVNAAEAGTHRVTVRYANANPGTGLASRRFTLTVNGTTHIPVLFPVTASWATWSTVTVLVPLTAGINQLDFHTGPDNNGPINIDHIVAAPATEITEQGVTLRIFNINTALQELCDLKPGQTPNVDVLRPTIDWTTAADWESYTANYLAQVVADLDVEQAGAYTFRLLSDDGSQAVHRRPGGHRPRRRPRGHDQGRRRHAHRRLARARDPLLPGRRRRAAPAAVAPPGPDDVRDRPDVRVLGRRRRRPRRRARRQGVRERSPICRATAPR